MNVPLKSIRDPWDVSAVTVKPPRFILFGLIFWTVLAVVLLLFFNTYIIRSYNTILFNEVKSTAQRDLLFRAWNNKFGGVYVPLSSGIVPNPYLHHTKRDVTTNYGDELTLVNPAWMTRQISEMQPDVRKGTVSTLTSSRLMNPHNAPDEWESKVLPLLENGEKEESWEIVHSQDDEGMIVRYATGLPVQEGCLNCHASQGYHVGEIRGIISTRMPVESFLRDRNMILFLVNACGIGVWAFGIFTLVGFRQRLKQYYTTNQKALKQLRENEQVLSMHRENLEELVDERTHKLAEATEESRKANTAKTLFLAHMSHEIRTPLNGVLGLSQLMSATRLDPKQEEYLRLIMLSGETLLSLVDDILDFSKIEANKLELSCHDFDLREKLQSVLGILATRNRDGSLEICLDVDPKIPRFVNGDARRLLQILINFAGNSVKFTHKGGVRLSATLKSEETDRVFVQFQISDTGIGVKSEVIPKLFESYTQADANISGKYGGTGLGLPIANSLVSLMGGHVEVESTVGVGTTFRFTVPFLKVKAENQLSNDLSEDFFDALPSLKGIRVLVVDDNRVLCESLSDQLRFWKMVPTVAHNAADAKATLKAEHDIQLLIVDEKFENTLGIEFLDDIRNDETLASTPAILLLPLSEARTKIENRPDISLTIEKPVNPSVLYDGILTTLFGHRINELLQQKSARREARQVLCENHENCRVLVAEDNSVNQVVIRELLRTHGYECDIAVNGVKAVDARCSKQYGFVLMDCQMPEMDGYTATNKIRRWEMEQSEKRIPIIALTANATKEDIQKCFDSGMDAYCSKPVNPTILFDIIDKLVPAVS